MATYLGTHGGRIQNYTTDPDNPNTGEVWYNGTANTIKIEAQTTAGSWATGGSLNTARQLGGGSGIYTAALYFGGSTAPDVDPGISALTELYDGSSWTEVNDLNTGRRGLGGNGTTTSALGYGGRTSTTTIANTESWNGSNWTEVADLNTARHDNTGNSGADNTSALSFGGFTPATFPPGLLNNTESWNGSSWTEVNNLNTARNTLAGFGTKTAALAVGGAPSGAVTESWNGTNWTEVNDLNTARNNLTGAGTTTSGLVFGGNTPPVTGKTEEWNGTNWTEVNDLNTARQRLSSSINGTTSASLAFGGLITAVTAATEEWTGAGSPVVKTISTD